MSAPARRPRSPERVWVSAPPGDWLSCPVCLDLLADPVSLSVCGHSFCRACVASSLARRRSCPSCVAAVPEAMDAAALPSNWLARNARDALRLRCRYGVRQQGDAWVADDGGCPAVLALDALAAHEASCAHAPAACPFAGCGALLRPGDAAAHDAACAAAHQASERAARLAGEARLAALEAAAAADRASLAAATRSLATVTRSLDAVDKRLEAVEARARAADAPSAAAAGWTLLASTRSLAVTT